MKPQKLISLSVQNFMRVSAVDIELSPEGELVILAGENEQGKSSVIKAIEYVLGGKRSNLSRPIKDGANEAKVVAELTDYVVTRTTAASGTSGFKVTTKDKRAVSSPQTLLDGFIGALSFDPLEFHRQATKEPQKAVATLTQLGGLDFSALDSKRKKLYDERTDANRTLEQSKAKIVGLKHDDSVPSEELNTAVLSEQLRKANEQLSANNIPKQHLFTLQSQLGMQKRTLASEQAELARLTHLIAECNCNIGASNAAIEKLNTDIAAKQSQIESTPTPDTQSITNQMVTIDGTNTKVRANKRLAELKGDIEVDEKSSHDLTAEIQAIDTQKETALKNARFPVAGISFNDAGVVLGGIPWDQCSTAQRLKASTSIGIALNPGLRAILIREGGNDLDKNSMAIMGQIAKESDVHIILERVSVGPDASFIIEDGHLKS